MAMFTSDSVCNGDISEHSRTIIHIDLDCFYAQVEMVKNPKLRDVPLGVQQKNIVVTSNYIAREYGVTKCMLVSEALKLCPQLNLVKGEDLHDYRQMSSKVTAIVQKYSPLVEKLGLDENFMDVSELVKSRINSRPQPVGHVYGNMNGYGSSQADEECACGCVNRLNIGSVIAAEVRKCIKDELGVTCCAGIAHNKLVAKLAGAVNKPNQQTVVYPNRAQQLLFSLADVRAIPGIGQSAADTLRTLAVRTVQQLQQCPLEKLQKALGADKAKTFMEFSYGKDASSVKPTGRPHTIGLEDSCRSISVQTEVKEKFRQLLVRLMVLVSEDGRIPRTIKVTVRKYDVHRKSSHREQKQCYISPSLFTLSSDSVQLSVAVAAEHKVMATIMHLFHKLVDISRPFHITLLGLAFTKFQERQSGKHSIASFFMKNISVQSVTSLSSGKDSANSCIPTPTPTTMDYSPMPQVSSDFTTDGSESEVEPSPKKTKHGAMIAKRRCLDASVECPSPSKLRVAELRLNSREMDRSPIESSHSDLCPDNVDPQVFKELPVDVQQELIQEWKIEKKTTVPSVPNAKTNTLLAYLIKNK